MVYLLPFIISKVKSITLISEEYPTIESTFPYTAFSTVDNSSNIILDGVERLSSHIFQLEVFTKDRVSCESISSQINDILIGYGFKRTSGPDRVKDGIFSKIMRFSGDIDEKTNTIYRR